MSKIETILSNLQTKFSGLAVDAVPVFAEVTQRLRAADEVNIKPSIDFVLVSERMVSMVDGVPEYECTIDLMIVQSSEPDVAIGKRIGDLQKLVRDALWSDRTLSQTAKAFRMGDWNTMYPLSTAGGSRLGVTAEIYYTYRE